MFSYISPEELMPQNHPLRAIRPLVNAALRRLSGWRAMFTVAGTAALVVWVLRVMRNSSKGGTLDVLMNAGPPPPIVALLRRDFGITLTIP